MNKILFTCIAALSLCFAPLSFSWNAVGHMVVATIAYQNLKPNAQKKIDKFLTYFNSEYENISTFPELATWPDSIRSQKIEMFTHWHYIDVAFTKDGSELPNLINEDNALWALGHVLNVVKYEKANNYERARFLAFLTHIVSDLHQPLHTVSLVTANLPKGDNGGNLYHVRFKGNNSNMHKIWDSGVGLLYGSTSVNNINYLAEMITSHYPKSAFEARATDLNPKNWLAEGMENAKNYVYTVAENASTDANYIDKGQDVAQQEIALAGYRLAAILNQIFG